MDTLGTDSLVRPQATGASDRPGQYAVDQISRHKIVAIIRGLSLGQSIAAGEALARGGIRALEVTFTGTANTELEATAEAIAALTASLEPTIAVGAGTVLTSAQLSAAAEAGARFVVSPDTNPEIIRETRDLGLASLPGAASPSECLTAWRAGADFVKLFPAGSLGIDYLKAIRSPLPWLPLLAVGGVDLGNSAAFLAAGASGLGIGGCLVNKKWIRSGELARVTETAKQFAAIVHEGTRQ